MHSLYSLYSLFNAFFVLCFVYCYDFVVFQKKNREEYCAFPRSISHFDGNKKRAKMNGSTWNADAMSVWYHLNENFVLFTSVYNIVCFLQLTKYNWTKWREREREHTKGNIKSLILLYYNWYSFFSLLIVGCFAFITKESFTNAWNIVSIP